MIIDDLHVRIEDKHKVTYGLEAKTTKRRARTKLIDDYFVEKYNKKFLAYKNKARPYTVPST